MQADMVVLSGVFISSLLMQAVMVVLSGVFISSLLMQVVMVVLSGVLIGSLLIIHVALYLRCCCLWLCVLSLTMLVHTDYLPLYTGSTSIQ